jgi:hypothetical protein
MIRVGSITGFYFFPLVMARVGLQQMMLWLAIFPFIGLLATLIIRWEPVGKDIEGEDQAIRKQAAAAGRGI